MKNNLPKGNFGENVASLYLQKKGYRIINRNFRSRYGEIDIIAINKNVLTFIEVKTRWSDEFGLPEEAVTYRKLKSIISTAQYFKLLHPKLPETLQIDIISIMVNQNKNYKIEHLQNVTA